MKPPKSEVYALLTSGIEWSAGADKRNVTLDTGSVEINKQSNESYDHPIHIIFKALSRESIFFKKIPNCILFSSRSHELYVFNLLYITNCFSYF